jgi:hypothetical protein
VVFLFWIPGDKAADLCAVPSGSTGVVATKGGVNNAGRGYRWFFREGQLVLTHLFKGER